jgi:hypothetical protein
MDPDQGWKAALLSLRQGIRWESAIIGKLTACERVGKGAERHEGCCRAKFVALSQAIHWHDDIVKVLKSRGRTVSNPEGDQLLYILVKHRQWAQTLDTLGVADELVQRPNFLKGKAGITKLLELRGQRCALATKAQSSPAPSRPPTIGEFTSSDGRYYLAKLFSKEHFQQESAELKHCLGRRWLDHYLSRTQKGELEIFSLREMETHKPVVTIEYNVDEKRIVQIKTSRTRANELVAKTGPYLPALMEALRHLCIGTAYDPHGAPLRRSVHSIADIRHLVPRGSLLLYNGRTITARGAVTLDDPQLIVAGNLAIPPDLEPASVARLCERLPIGFDLTHATDRQRQAIGAVRGSLFDASASAAYGSLVHIACNLDLPRARQLDLHQLQSVGGNLHVASAGTFYAPRLRSVGGSFAARRAMGVVAPDLQSVGGGFDARCARRLLLPRLRWIGADLDVRGVATVDLRQLEHVRGLLNAENARMLNLPQLRTIGQLFAPRWYRLGCCPAA